LTVTCATFWTLEPKMKRVSAICWPLGKVILAFVAEENCNVTAPTAELITVGVWYGPMSVWPPPYCCHYP